MKKIYHDLMTEEEKEVVDGIYNIVNEYCKDNNIKIAYDDRAENFIESIAEYLEESKK